MSLRLSYVHGNYFGVTRFPSPHGVYVIKTEDLLRGVILTETFPSPHGVYVIKTDELLEARAEFKKFPSPHGVYVNKTWKTRR